jgi:hypothetical protein
MLFLVAMKFSAIVFSLALLQSACAEETTAFSSDKQDSADTAIEIAAGDSQIFTVICDGPCDVLASLEASGELLASLVPEESPETELASGQVSGPGVLMADNLPAGSYILLAENRSKKNVALSLSLRIEAGLICESEDLSLDDAPLLALCHELPEPPDDSLLRAVAYCSHGHSWAGQRTREFESETCDGDPLATVPQKLFCDHVHRLGIDDTTVVIGDPRVNNWCNRSESDEPVPYGIYKAHYHANAGSGTTTPE